MTKSKNFFFAVATAMIMLFILGNRVTSAEATTTRIVDATPVPTIIPTETSPGVIPSAEEQEVLKVIVQSYIEIRYRALSVSDSDDFKQNSFGNMISETSEAMGFLREEMGKLAVELKHAQLDHLRYVNYKVFLDFRSITVDPSTQVATIAVSEGNEVVYEISAEINPENPIISNTAGIEHTIILHKKQHGWKIVSDTYNDDLWRMLRQSGTSTDEILRTTDEMIRTMKAAPRPSFRSNNVEVAPAYVIPDDLSSHPYNRAGAVAYALSYWGVVEGEYTHPEGYNHDYAVYSGVGGDCQNFVSQAIYEGGDASMYIPDNLIPSPPLTTDGQMGWFYLNDMQRASAWAGVDDFYSTVITLGNYALAGNDFYGEGPEGVDITLPQNDQVPPELDLGDVIQYDYWPSDGYWDHSAIVVDFQDGLPYVASHTTDYRRVPYTLQTNTNYRFIHIERSNGHPPVKSKIQGNIFTGESDDDAGTFTLLPDQCTPFLSNANEIYFGTCFGSGANITSGFQFRDIQIPYGAQIKYAYITFTVDGPYTNPLELKIDGETTGSPAVFTESNPPGSSSRILTNNPIPWSINDTDPGDNIDTLTWTLGMRRTVPNLSGIVQAMVGGSWQSGNSLSFIFSNNGSTSTRRVIAYERAVSDPNLSTAKLIAAYTFDGTPPPTNTPITPTSTTPPPTSTPVPTDTPTPAPTTPAPTCDCIILCDSSTSQSAGLQTINSVDETPIAFDSPLEISASVNESLIDPIERAALIYRVRDELMSNTTEGQRLTDLYYDHSLEIAVLMLADNDLYNQGFEALDAFLPGLQAVVDGNGGSVTITTEQVNAAQAFLDELSVRGSPELQQAIQEEQENYPLESTIGLTMDQAWEEINPPSDLIFSDGFESGDFSAWYWATTDGGDLSVNTQSAAIGNYGMQALFDDNHELVVYDHTPNNEKHYSVRFYFDPNSMQLGSNDGFYVFSGSMDPGWVACLNLQQEGAYYSLSLCGNDDAGTWLTNDAVLIADEWQAVEIEWQAATAPGANNGYIKMWIGDQLADTIENIDNDTQYITKAGLGATNGTFTASGTMYFDAFESHAGSHIGLDPNGPAVSPPPVRPDSLFANDFQSGNLSAWNPTLTMTDGGDLVVSTSAGYQGGFGLKALIDDTVNLRAVDSSPADEKHYRARFYFNPNSLTMSSGNVHSIFDGMRMSTNDAVIRVELIRESGAYKLRAKVMNDAYTYLNSSKFTISNSWHAVELEWQASTAPGANNGVLKLWIDGTLMGTISNVDNDTNSIGEIRLGAVSGIDSGTSGSMYFDNFVSRRNTYIGP